MRSAARSFISLQVSRHKSGQSGIKSRLCICNWVRKGVNCRKFRQSVWTELQLLVQADRRREQICCCDCKLLFHGMWRAACHGYKRQGRYVAVHTVGEVRLHKATEKYGIRPFSGMRRTAWHGYGSASDTGEYPGTNAGEKKQCMYYYPNVNSEYFFCSFWMYRYSIL